jgi:hypothetical protein
MSEIKRLETLVARYRALLAQAEAALEEAKNREPKVGDFVRSTLTSFYGCVTKVTARPRGRPWVEIKPYLTENLQGKSTLDLYEQWEIIDPPRAPDERREASVVDITTRLAASLRKIEAQNVGDQH